MRVITRSIKVFSERWYAYPLVLFALGCISYLYQLPRMGFYWDDWQAVLLYQMNDPKAISAYFAYDRPFSAWTYQILFPILPMNAGVWQIATLLFRVLGILALVYALHLVWPKRGWVLKWAGLLMLVAPAFASQPIALAFNQHFLTWLLFSTSILLTGLSLKKRGLFWKLTPFAWLATAAHLFTMEYFAGLEILRVVYIYLFVSAAETRKWAAVRKTALLWLPYALITSIFIYWRLMIYPDQAPGLAPNDPILLNQFILTPLQGAIDLLTRAFKDIIHLLLTSWVDPISPAEIDFTAKATLFSWGVGFIVASLAAVIMYYSLDSKRSLDITDKFHARAILLGGAAVLFGGLPVWLMARQITEGRWSDRFSLAPLPGAILILVVLIDWAVRTKVQKHILLAVLLAVSISFQMRNVNKYRLDWEYQRDYYWQLVWRMPSLESGTAIFSPNNPVDRLSDYATAFAVNVLFAGKGISASVPYWFITPRYLDTDSLVAQPQQELRQDVRTIRFSGSTSAMVSVYYEPSVRCLKVLDEMYQLDPFLTKVDPAFYWLNHSARIQTSAGPIQPPTSIFGNEPAHDWCYYFQKADLARQNRQWQAVINLMTEASERGFSPAAGSELLPLLDSHLHLEQWDQAITVVDQILTIPGETGPAVCVLLSAHEENQSTVIPAWVSSQIRLAADCP